MVSSCPVPLVSGYWSPFGSRRMVFTSVSSTPEALDALQQSSSTTVSEEPKKGNTVRKQGVRH